MAIFYEKSLKSPWDWMRTSGCDTINVHQFVLHDDKILYFLVRNPLDIIVVAPLKILPPTLIEAKLETGFGLVSEKFCGLGLGLGRVGLDYSPALCMYCIVP